MRIRNGDLLKILGDGNVDWYAEKVGNDDGRYEVYYIERVHPDSILYKYENEYCTVDKESIIAHVRNENDYVKAWAQLGFDYQVIDGDIFLKKVDSVTDMVEYDVLSTDTSDSDSVASSVTLDSKDTWSSTDDNDHDSEMEDFIVSDFLT